MKKYLRYSAMSAVVILSAIADWSFVSESLQLADTCVLWMHGKVMGWVEIVLFCLVMDAFISLPAILVWNDLKD